MSISLEKRNGKIYAHATGVRQRGGVDNVEYFGGATLINKNTSDGLGSGMTLGNYILGKNLQASTDDETFMHEYGHTLQSRQWGLFYFVPAITSGLDYIIGNGSERWRENGLFTNHHIRWYETEANRKASRYFAKYYGVVWNDRENPRSKDIARGLRLR